MVLGRPRLFSAETITRSLSVSSTTSKAKLCSYMKSTHHWYQDRSVWTYCLGSRDRRSFDIECCWPIVIDSLSFKTCTFFLFQVLFVDGFVQVSHLLPSFQRTLLCKLLPFTSYYNSTVDIKSLIDGDTEEEIGSMCQKSKRKILGRGILYCLRANLHSAGSWEGRYSLTRFQKVELLGEIVTKEIAFLRRSMSSWLH